MLLTKAETKRRLVLGNPAKNQETETASPWKRPARPTLRTFLLALLQALSAWGV
jgi:hypothetical protein